MNQPSARTVTEARATGWIASFVLHGALALGVFTFLQHITLAPQTTPFTWNVAMVPPTGPTKPAHTPAHQSARAAAPAPKPLPAQTETESQPTESLTPTMDGRTPTPPAPRLLQEHTPSRPMEHAPLLSAMDPVAQDSRAADLAPDPPTPTTTPMPTSSPSIEPPPSAHDAPVTASKDFSAPQQTTTSTEPQVAALGPATSDKPDYGWLTDDMVRWYEEFNKFYPPELRLEGTAGRVKLRMLLGKDGAVSDVRIAESSGNPRLDQAAMEIIRKAPPIKLSRPLGQANKPIAFWYRFNLEPAR